MSEKGDNELIERCKSGEKQAWEDLVEKYHRVVFNVAFRMLNDRSEAEEITQAVFVRIVERLQDFDSKHKFFSWIYKIAVNESLNHRRSRNGKERISEEIQSQEISPDKRYEEAEISAGVRQALMRLTEEYRAVVVLRHFQGLAYDEIAKILEVPEKTIKSRLFTARLRLREILMRNLT